MLRRLKVRGRLLVVSTVPLVLLLAVATPEVWNRWERSEEADDAATLAEAAVDVAGALHAVQQERVLSAAHRAGAVEQVAAGLDDQRAATDAAVTRARAALEDIAGAEPRLATGLAAAVEALGSLGAVRAETDAAQSIVPWFDPFGPIVESLLSVLDGVGTVVSDAGVGDELTQLALVARTKEAAAAQAAQVAAAAVWGGLRGDHVGILSTLRADELAYRTAYLAATPSSERVERRAEVQARPVITADRAVDEMIAAGDVSVTGGLRRWLDTSSRRLAALRDVEAARAAAGLGRARAVGDESRRAAAAYAALAGGGLLAALAVALVTTRSITRPLRRLTDAADELAEERLPRLVDALRNPGDDDERYLTVTLEPIPVRSDDELAHLGRAFNAVQEVAVDVAAQQADLLRKGISDLYVNLARRNQSLLERQIELLDRLEAGEEDPEVLEHLYLLDHLATRMRRNAESLLVLAGAESGTRRGRDVEMVEVVRAAVSEVEAYDRVELGEVGTGALAGPAVSDVAHLLAELLENATAYSPPSTTVRVDGARLGGSYQLVITDEGVGMTPEQLDELNEIFRDPPVTGLALGRSLGCLVAARLAARHSITVRLRPAPSGGVVAQVVLPASLLVADDDAVPAASAVPRALQTPVQRPVAPVPAVRDAGASTATDRVERLVDALPPRAAFEAALGSLLDEDAPATLVEPAVGRVTTMAPPAQDRGEVAPLAGRVEPPPPEQPPGTAPSDGLVSPEVRRTLARRVPGAHSAGFGARPAGAQGRRSPEEVREILLKYRSGLRAGRASAPRQEEGT